MKQIHVRCSKEKCKKRRLLPKHPEEYFKFDRKKKHFVNHAPPCENCGENKYRVDQWKIKYGRNIGDVICNCSGYNHLTRRIFPHRQGSKYCWYRKDGSQRMEGDPDFRDSEMEEQLYQSNLESRENEI